MKSPLQLTLLVLSCTFCKFAPNKLKNKLTLRDDNMSYYMKIL